MMFSACCKLQVNYVSFKQPQATEQDTWAMIQNLEIMQYYYSISYMQHVWELWMNKGLLLTILA